MSKVPYITTTSAACARTRDCINKIGRDALYKLFECLRIQIKRALQ